jgi:hypothetical protein
MADEMVSQETTDTAETVTDEVTQETDWKAEARKWESRAKQSHAAAKSNEGAAQRLAEIEEAQKTEAQKSQERLDAAESRASELELRSIRAEVAAAKGVPVGLLSGGTLEELEASADALIAFRGEQGGKGLHVPIEGKAPTSGSGSDVETVRSLFGKRD